jgi:hypothetical protein
MTNHTDTDARCLVRGCNGQLFLELSYACPLYTTDPPWPGHGPIDYTPTGAVTSAWQVQCTEGHTTWTHVDQVRHDNAAGLTDDDETGDHAPTFRLDALPR